LRLSRHGIKIAPRTYYVFRSRTVLARARSDAELVSQFAMVHGDNCGAYGARKASYEQRRPCHTDVARCTLERLMQFDGLRGVSWANSPRTQIPARWLMPEDIVNRRFTAAGRTTVDRRHHLRPDLRHARFVRVAASLALS